MGYFLSKFAANVNQNGQQTQTRWQRLDDKLSKGLEKVKGSVDYLKPGSAQRSNLPKTLQMLLDAGDDLAQAAHKKNVHTIFRKGVAGTVGTASRAAKGAVLSRANALIDKVIGAPKSTMSQRVLNFIKTHKGPAAGIALGTLGLGGLAHIYTQNKGPFARPKPAPLPTQTTTYLQY